jgi:phage protein D
MPLYALPQTTSTQFVPDYAMSINGSAIPTSLKSSIVSITFDSGLNAADRLEVVVANPGLTWLQSHINGLGFLPFPTNVRIGPIQTPNFDGTGLFDMGNKIALSLGYSDVFLTDVFEGEITGIEVNLTSDGMPTVTIVAHNYLYRLGQGSYGRGFGPLPDALIAAILGAENLLLPTIDPTVTAGSTAIAVVNYIFNGSGRKQKAQTDLQLMKEIAEFYDADFWVEGNTFYLSRLLKPYSPNVTLTWGQSLIDFQPKVSTVGSVFGVAVKFTLREIPFSFLVTASWDMDTQSLAIMVVPGGSAAYLKSLIGPIISIINRPISSPPDIINSALFITRKLRNTINNRLTAAATAVGDPAILANVVVQFNGLGPDFSGDYRVTNAQHRLDSEGYRTRFKVRKEILP